MSSEGGRYRRKSETRRKLEELKVEEWRKKGRRSEEHKTNVECRKSVVSKGSVSQSDGREIKMETKGPAGRGDRGRIGQRDYSRS